MASAHYRCVEEPLAFLHETLEEIGDCALGGVVHIVEVRHLQEREEAPSCL